MSMDNWLFVVDSIDELRQKGLGCKYSILINGVNSYTGATEADYRENGAVILTSEEFDQIVKEHDDALCSHWKEESEEQYEYALNVLPPMRWYAGGFFVPEAYTSDLYDFHQELDGHYYTSLQRSGSNREQILESLRNHIANTNHEN